MNLSFVLVFVSSAALVIGQLAVDQHTALIRVFDAAGALVETFLTPRALPILFRIAGCGVNDCTYFAANQPCSGEGIVCNGTDVVALFVTERIVGLG